MRHERTLDDLWAMACPETAPFDPEQHLSLLPKAQRYLRHALAPGTRLAVAVRLRMHGTIKLGRWLPFTAEQVIHRDHGMLWVATVRWFGLPIRGSDRLSDGAGAMRWTCFGLPVLNKTGPDITRSTVGRAQVESVWLPSLLAHRDVVWTSKGTDQLQASAVRHGSPMDLALTIDPTGRIQTAALPRWGDPDGTGFREEIFGAMVDDEATFEGITIPTRLRVGWFLGTPRFATDGEFFRVTIDHATFR
jgi:hypothetical protein